MGPAGIIELGGIERLGVSMKFINRDILHSLAPARDLTFDDIA